LRKNLLFLNVLLLALIAVVSWRLWGGYQEALRSQAEFLRAKVPPPAAPVVSIPPPPAQVSAVNYYDIASKLPFSKDRNPTVVVDVEAPKPMPALPKYYGMMNFGGGPRVILALGGQAQKSYAPGDKIGDFKLTTIAATGLVFDWEGKAVTAPYEQLKDTSNAPPVAAPVAASAAAAPAAPAPSSGGVTSLSSVTSVGGTQASRPGADVGASIKGCQAGDTAPAGTVSDGYRKVMTETPFGKSCRWEKVN
jgi:hypothetical protein